MKPVGCCGVSILYAKTAGCGSKDMEASLRGPLRENRTLKAHTNVATRVTDCFPWHNFQVPQMVYLCYLKHRRALQPKEPGDTVWFAMMQKQFLVSSRQQVKATLKSVNIAASRLSDSGTTKRKSRPPIFDFCQNPPYKSPATAGASS